MMAQGVKVALMGRPQQAPVEDPAAWVGFSWPSQNRLRHAGFLSFPKGDCSSGFRLLYNMPVSVDGAWQLAILPTGRF